MTYPPQGPYGQQPDPYGQQQPDPYGQYGGGYQQPAGQYGGGYDPNAQYGGGAQYGGLGGPPPKKNTGPIIAVVAIVVLLLAGLGITGFVAPGFFLSDDKKEAGSGSGDNSSTKSEGGDSDVDAFAKKLVAAADEQDKSALRDLTCSEAEDIVDAAIESIDDTKGAELEDTKKESANEYVVVINITHDDGTDPYDATINKVDGDWCWQDFEGDEVPTGGGDTPTDEPTDDTETSAPPTGGGGGGSEGEDFVQSFLDKLNAGDGAGANALLCPDSTSQSDVSEAAGKSPSLEMDPAGTQADSSYVGADLKGTMGGAEITSARTSAFLEDAGWCIYTFYAY